MAHSYRRHHWLCRISDIEKREPALGSRIWEIKSKTEYVLFFGPKRNKRKISEISFQSVNRNLTKASSHQTCTPMNQDKWIPRPKKRLWQSSNRVFGRNKISNVTDLLQILPFADSEIQSGNSYFALIIFRNRDGKDSSSKGISVVSSEGETNLNKSYSNRRTTMKNHWSNSRLTSKQFSVHVVGGVISQEWKEYGKNWKKPRVRLGLEGSNTRPFPMFSMVM